MPLSPPIIILLADDDPDDRLLTREALFESGLKSDLRCVEDGEALMAYLGRCGTADPSPRPDLILLDLNMPRMDGYEVLRAIRSVPSLRAIPVVVFSTSSAAEDIAQSYDLGANSFITKPASFEALVSAMRVLGAYWFEVAQLPSRAIGGRRG